MRSMNYMISITYYTYLFFLSITGAIDLIPSDVQRRVESKPQKRNIGTSVPSRATYVLTAASTLPAYTTPLHTSF